MNKYVIFKNVKISGVKCALKIPLKKNIYFQNLTWSLKTTFEMSSRHSIARSTPHSCYWVLMIQSFSIYSGRKKICFHFP